MAAKFTYATGGMVGTEGHVEAARRVQGAVEDMADRQARGKAASVETSVDGPTGSSYAARRDFERQQAKEAASFQRQKEEDEIENARLEQKMKEVEDAGSDSDEEFLDDPELQQLRAARLNKLKDEHNSRLENLAKGHGQYREIVQDDFLTEVTGSEKVVCHFYHRDFERCKIMDKHLAKLAPQHLESKFIKIDAEKTPFFVQKLQVRVLPTVVCFVDGIATGRLVGFDDLGGGMKSDTQVDEFPTRNLAKKLAELKIIAYTAVPSESELAMWDLSRKQAVRSGIYNDYESEEENE